MFDLLVEFGQQSFYFTITLGLVPCQHALVWFDFSLKGALLDMFPHFLPVAELSNRLLFVIHVNGPHPLVISGG